MTIIENNSQREITPSPRLEPVTSILHLSPYAFPVELIMVVKTVSSRAGQFFPQELLMYLGITDWYIHVLL